MTPPCPNCQTNREVVECVMNKDKNVIAWCCDYCNLVWEVKPDGRNITNGLTQADSLNQNI